MYVYLNRQTDVLNNSELIIIILQIHNKGVKFGLYQDYGTNTCAGYPGVIKHMALDAQTFADWDVDYVKLDGCYADINDMDQGYPEFGRLLNGTGRPMVYSCSWPVYQEYEGKLVGFFGLYYRKIEYNLDIF